jgi:hypothetical protein
MSRPDLGPSLHRTLHSTLFTPPISRPTSYVEVDNKTPSPLQQHIMRAPDEAQSAEQSERTPLLAPSMDELEQGLPASNTASDVKASECLISLHASIEPSTHGLQVSLQSSPHPTPWRTFSQRAKYYVPGLQWIPHYTLGR